VLWVRPTPVGERAWLLMMPGLSATDLEDRTEHLAAACWARDARVHRVRSLAALVRVDVIRRDPLTRPEPITNPLMHRTSNLPAAETAGTPEVPPVPVAALTEGESASEPATPISTATRHLERSTRSPRPEKGSTAVMVNGEDVSDYV
jgi:hypothetical protein